MKRTATILLFVFISVNQFTRAQGEIPPGWDDPNFDRVPYEMLRGATPPLPLEAVVTIDGYDNYNIGSASAEPHAMMNPRNPLQIFAAYNINSTFRTMNGFDWTAQTPAFGATMAGDPVVAYDSLGNLYYENMYGSTIVGCKVIKSTDNGITWSPSVTAVAGNDKNWIACDQTAGPYANYIYTTMTNNGVGSFYRSTDFGATFASTTTLTPQALPGMMVAVGPDVSNGNNISGGCVYVVTHSGSNAAGVYNFFVSTNGGTSFTAKGSQSFSNIIGTEVSSRSTVSGMRCRPYPMIAADNSWGPNRGRLYLVYASNNPVGSGNKSDVFCRYSTDQGATWSAAKTVNDDSNNTANHSFFPAIWCDTRTGRLYVKFYDTRLCPTSDSMDVFATYSDNGGVSFKPNQRLTNKTFKIKLSTSGTAPAYQGDYDAITSYGRQAMAVWTDFRANGYACYTGYFPDYAMTVSPSTANVFNTNDSTFIAVAVPSVKLYDDKVKFTATVTPAPAAGTIQVNFAGADSLLAFPGQVSLRVKTIGTVTTGNYVIEVTGQGPNGMPVHKRQIGLLVGELVPVELISFRGEKTNGGIRIDWRTATETNNKGFDVERLFTTGTSATGWQKIGFVGGAGQSTELRDYSFTDREINRIGSYAYRLRQVDFDGTVNYSGIVELEVKTPYSFTLEQNYPNPFNPATHITFALAEGGNTSLKVYDVTGREVATVFNEFKSAGSHSVLFSAAGFNSGVYFYELKGEKFTLRKKMTLLK